MIPTSVLFSSTIGTPEMRYLAITASASDTILSGVRENGLVITPLSERFTRSTSSACCSTDIFLWMTPMPPSRAIAIAIAASVTVSIPALIRGTFNFTFLLSVVATLTSFGNTSDLRGTNKTSSNVSPSLANFVSHTRMFLPLFDLIPIVLNNSFRSPTLYRLPGSSITNPLKSSVKAIFRSIQSTGYSIKTLKYQGNVRLENKFLKIYYCHLSKGVIGCQECSGNIT